MRDYTNVRFFTLLEKTVVFFYIFLFFIFTLYLAGNFQVFLDRTQKLLLGISEIVSFLLIFLSILYGIVLVVSGAGRKSKHLRKFLFFLLASISRYACLFYIKNYSGLGWLIKPADKPINKCTAPQVYIA